MDDILDASLRHPNYYTRSVLHMVATVDTELGNSIKPFTRYIDQMIYKSIKEKSDEEILPLYKQEEQGLTLELDQLKSQLDHISNNNRKVPKKKRRLTKQDAMEVDETASHHWRLYENWKACPMGTLPNGKVPCLDLSVLLSTKE
ncbi:hypothetical protein A0J61_11837 [Choanephora cucurbitarum]|uniref:Uncharacterized protein n=1 Tax=Choanephora cucurbitarum TaxID=101091 RepID=A0A1C7MYB5_9FUNG|nr:hypothetical protein A0J61_11837 [Choanephora cucurbitarum]